MPAIVISIPHISPPPPLLTTHRAIPSNVADKTTEHSLRSLFLPHEALGPGQIARPRAGTAIVDFMMPMHAIEASQRLDGKE
ncbi:hypothetical protein Q7P36_002312 [Cladosporium allicinum]